MKSRTWFFSLCLAGTPLFLSAEVFSLWPFSGNESIGVEEATRPAPLWTEKVIVNGRSLELGVALNRNSLEVCRNNLRKLYPNASFAENANSLLAEIKLKNGLRRRIYLLAIDGIYPVISFSMDLPPSGMKAGEWPSEFPLPPGATPVMTMRFPARNAVYGAFTSSFDVRQTLPSLASSLQSMGWSSVSGEHQNPLTGSGEIFLRNDSSSMLVIGLTPRKDGGCFGTIYQRKNK